MAGLDFCSKHNMVAYLEKNDGNTEFHQIMDFLTNSSIHFALTVSPIISTSFVEQFWTSAKSRTVLLTLCIDAIVVGKPVTISEASIRSDLLFDDADGIDTLNNQAIFDTIQLMGFLQIFLKNQLRDVPVPMDHFPVPTLTKKVLSFMVKKGKNFSGNVTPLFNSMLVQPTEDEGEVSERPSESQPIPSPTHPTKDQPESQPDPSPRPYSPNPITDSNPEGSGGNHGAQAAEIKDLKAQIKQLKKKAIPVINHHKAWFRAAKLKKQQNKKDIKKPKKRRSVSKQGRKAVKSSKGAPSVQTNTDWDALDTDLDETINEAMDYTFAQDEGKTDSKVEEPETSSKTEEFHLSGDTLVVKEKDSVEKGVSTEDQVSTDKPKVSTDKPKVNTDKIDEGTAEPKDGNSDESAAPATVFRDDETIAEFLVSMSQNKAKQKGVEIKDTEDTDRPRTTSERSILTLKPLPKIDPKDKGKKVLEEEDESDAESEGVNEAEKKFKMLANDEEMARKVQEEWEAEEEKKRLAEEEATKAAFTNEYDFIQARLNADKILAEKLQEEEREKFTIEERAKLLHDTIAAQRRFLAQQRSEVIRNRLPSRTQLRNQMMTYLKHVGGKKHSDLKTKIFEEIQVLYEKLKRSDENFIAIGSIEDERLIKDLNKKAACIKKADSIENESKEEESPDEEKEVDYEILEKKYPIIEWKSKHLRIKPQYDETKDLEEINLNAMIRSSGQRRHFSTLMKVLAIFDRDDLNVVYQLVMDRYKDEIPEGVRTLMTDEGLVIHMLVEKQYPLRKKVLVQMIELELESEEDNTMDQTVPGKDKSNLLIADSFLKTIWFSIYLVVYNEELAIPEQTATSKGTSNSLMAGGLSKTTKPT
ncbi:hypothetical protein Tco_0886339 [Tanacetum coccineum]